MDDRYEHFDKLSAMEQPIAHATTKGTMDAHPNSGAQGSWESEIAPLIAIACRECVQLRHDNLHAIGKRGVFAGANPYECKRPKCRELFREMLAEEFQRRDDCCPGDQHPSRRVTSTSRGMAASHTFKIGGRRPKNSITMQVKHGNERLQGSAIPPNDRVHKSPKLTRANHADDKSTPSHGPSDVLQIVGAIAGSHWLSKSPFDLKGASLLTQLCQDFGRDTAENRITGERVNETRFAPEAIVIDTMCLAEPRRPLNLQILDTYEHRTIPEDFVKQRWGYIRKEIHLYDHFVHGGELFGDAGNDLGFLEESTPFCELPDIRQESGNQGVIGCQSDLVRVLRSMFRVEPQFTVSRKVAFLGPNIVDMKLSTLLRGVLAYLLYTEIFTMKEDDPGHEDHFLALEELLGAETAAKTYQYCRLKSVEGAQYQACLKERSMGFTELFYSSLFPLTHQVTDSPTNVRTKHYRKLSKIILASLELAAKLNAYQGSTTYQWEEYGAAYQHPLFDVDHSQVDEVERMSNSTKAMQRVAFTVIPAIQRTMPGDDRVMTYGRGIVVLQTPYVE